MIPSTDSSTSRQKKIFFWAAIALFIGIGIWLFLFLRHPRNITSQAAPVRNSVQSRSPQIGGNTNNTQIARQEETYPALKEQLRPFDQPVTRLTPQNIHIENRNPIRSIVMYARFTYETESGVEFPLAEVPAVPREDAYAYLEGPGGTVRLDLLSVRFERQNERLVIVNNDFSLQTSSGLYLRAAVETLKNFDFISIPIMTAGYESLLKKMVYVNCRLEVNGRRYTPNWSYSADSIPTEEGGTTIRIPISEAVKQQFEEKK